MLLSVRPSVCPTVAYIANNLRTSFKIKWSKVKVTRSVNANTHRAPYLPNGKAYELQTWYANAARQPASATGAKVKGQGRKVT